MTFQNVLEKIENKGLDPYNLENIISEFEYQNVTYSREDIENHLSSNQRFNYNSTQNDVALLMSQIGRIYNPQNLADVSCGLGNILIHCDFCNVVGYDINKNIIDIAKFISPQINFINTDSLKITDKNKYDAIVSHFPYGRVQIDGRKDDFESAFINKSLEILNENGVLICLVPERFLFGSNKNFFDLREKIIQENNLRGIISFNTGFFENTGIKRSILIIEKKYSKEETQFIEYLDIKKTINKLGNQSGDFSIPKSKLLNRWDFSFHNPEHKEIEEQLDSFETKKIEELVEIIMGVPFKSEERMNSGNFQILSPRNIANGKFEPSDNDKFLNKSEINNREEKAILKDGDIIFPRFYRDKIGVYIHSSHENKLIANQHLIILRGKNAEYVATYLNTENGIKLFNQQIKRYARGNVIPTISLRDLKNIQIPILPIEDLELASKRKLEKLSYEALLKINEKYISLKSEFNNLKKENTISAHEAQLNSMQETLNEVLSNQKVIATKLDDIKSTLIELTNDFKQIKDLPRDIDEKIIRLNENLDSKLDNLLKDQKQIDFYIAEIKRWFDFYDILEIKSQKYLPEAEYIFDHISKLENPDYSPFILQYCRALENELLKKIFRAYVQSLIDRNINLEKDFAWDFGRKESGKLNNDNTYKLAKHLQSCLRKPEEEWFFELGSMEVNLRYLTGKTVEKSPLLQDLKNFVLEKFRQEFLNIEYLDDIKTIIRDYRNQSAHPNLIDTEKAVKFHKQMKECLISLMENYKQ
jgi:hypothetical protein